MEETPQTTHKISSSFSKVCSSNRGLGITTVSWTENTKISKQKNKKQHPLKDRHWAFYPKTPNPWLQSFRAKRDVSRLPTPEVTKELTTLEPKKKKKGVMRW